MLDGILYKRLYQHAGNFDQFRLDVFVYGERVGEGETELFQFEVKLYLFDLVGEGNQLLFGSGQYLAQEA